VCLRIRRQFRQLEIRRFQFEPTIVGAYPHSLRNINVCASTIDEGRPGLGSCTSKVVRVAYVFEALENGRVTRILSADESHIYATLLTQPEERREPLDNPMVTMKESPKGEVQRIDSWFFAGESIGNEFLYPGMIAEGRSESKLDSFTSETGHMVTVAVEDAAVIPEYVAVHVERAVVGSSVATGRFFRANFLVN
jgi:hypothetical protein